MYNQIALYNQVKNVSLIAKSFRCFCSEDHLKKVPFPLYSELEMGVLSVKQPWFYDIMPGHGQNKIVYMTLNLVCLCRFQ